MKPSRRNSSVIWYLLTMLWVRYRFMKWYDRKDYHARCITELSIVIAQLCVTLKNGKEREKKKRKKNHVVRFSPREACKQRVFRYVFFVSDILHTYIRLSALLTTTYDYLRLLRVRATINAGLFRIRRHATFLACNRRSGWPWNYLGPTLSILRM